MRPFPSLGLQDLDGADSRLEEALAEFNDPIEGIAQGHLFGYRAEQFGLPLQEHKPAEVFGLIRRLFGLVGDICWVLPGQGSPYWRLTHHELNCSSSLC